MKRFFAAWWRKIIILIILVAIGFGGYYGAKAYMARNNNAQRANRLATATATKGSIVVSVNGSGTVEGIAQEDITLSSGTVKKVYVKEGDTVKKGDLMYELENPDLELSVKQAESNLEEAQASLDDYEERLSKTNVFAPISGLLTMKVSPGDTVNEGTAIASIQDISSLVLSVPVEAERINDVKKGQSAIISVDGINGNITGTVKEVKSDACVAVISVSDKRLQPGMTASVIIKAGSKNLEGLYGTLEATTSPVQVKSPMSGTIKTVYVSNGVVNVTQGEELIKLDTTDLEKEIASQRLEIKKAEASIEQLKVEIKQKQAALDDSQEKLSNAVVTAPITGLLTINVNEGENVEEGSVLATVQDISVLSISVPSHDILVPGDLVQVTAEDDRSYVGTVKKLQSGTAVIEVSGSTLRPNMSASVEIDDEDDGLDVITEYGVLSTTVSPTQVKAPFSGSISKIYAEDDTLVTEGEDILKFDKTSLRNSIASQNLEIEQLKNDLSQTEYDLEQMQSALKENQRQLAKYVITAPASGKLTMNVAISDKVDANELLATIITADNSVVRVTAPVGGTISGIYSSSLVKAGQQLASFDTETIEDNITAQKLKVEEAQANLKIERDKLDKLKVYAPIDGIVVAQNVEEGEETSDITSSSSSSTSTSTTTSTTSASTSTKAANVAATIINYDKMEVDVPVDELDINKIQVGQKAIITSDALPDQQFEGEVSSISEEGTSQNGVTSFNVTVVFDKVESMKSGMTVDVEIIAQQKDDVIVVPIEAIVDRNGQKFVMIYAENSGNMANNGFTQNNMRQVKTGISNETYIEITDGLKEGEKVILQSTSSQDTNNSNASMRGMFGIPGGGNPPAGGPPADSQRPDSSSSRQSGGEAGQ